MLRSAGQLEHFLLINVILKKSSTMSRVFSAVSRNKQSLSWFPVSNYLLFSQLNLPSVFPSLKWRVVTMSAETCNLNNAIWFCGGENKTDHLFLCLHPHVQFTASSNSLESRWDRYTYGWLAFPECDLTLCLCCAYWTAPSYMVFDPKAFSQFEFSNRDYVQQPLTQTKCPITLIDSLNCTERIEWSVLA